MRANTNRSMALAFGELIDHYDAGRPRVPVEFVARIMCRCALARPDRVLEVGSGSGQLTGALLTTGARLVALEPSAPMASRLRGHHQDAIDSGQLTVVEDRFEQLGDVGRFDQIWSADAWHWVDPAVGYRRAAQLLRPYGCLVATWTLAAVVNNLSVADQLNEVFAEHSPDLVRAPRRPVDEALLQSGRNEIAASGQLAVADSWIDHAVIEVSAHAFAEWQLSYAQISALSSAERAPLRRAILGALAAYADRLVPVSTHRYVVVSQPRTGKDHGVAASSPGEVGKMSQ